MQNILSNGFELKILGDDNYISQKHFNEFFKIIKDSFPKSERRTKEAFYSLFKNESCYFAVSLLKNDEVVCFFTIWKLKNFYFGDHFATRADMRNLKLGSILLNYVKETLDMPFVIEVEPDENELTHRRIEFYKRHGFVLNDFDYFLPPMMKGCKPLFMKIMSYPIKVEKDITDEIYKSVYNTKKSCIF